MRVALGQLWQETNTLNPLPTTRRDFEQFGVLRGDDLLAQLAETNEIGGFLEALKAWPRAVEPVGLARLPAWPSGRATRATFDWLLAEMLEALDHAGHVDAVLLALHGALTAEEHPDVEGEVLAAIRARIGPRVPLVASLDLHANITAAMVEAADALALFHTAPHIDVYETGQRAGRLLGRMVCEGARPTTALLRLPMAPPAERANTQDTGSPRAMLKNWLVALEASPGILAAGVATVQPWLDVPDLASTVVVVADGDLAFAEQQARAVAGELWRERASYLPELVSHVDAVRLAHATPRGLVVISDAADATTSGAPGDSTWLLEELLKYSWRGPALVTLVAPEVIAQVAATGIGGRYRGPLGGVRDARFSRPLAIDATIERLFDARFTLSGHIGRNLAIDMGRGAVLRVGQVAIVLTERTGPHFAPELFRAAGYEPRDAAVLVAKSPCGFRAAYEPLAARILSAQAPGCAPPNFWDYEYHHRPRPLWPWERDTDWNAEQAPVIMRLPCETRR